MSDIFRQVYTPVTDTQKAAVLVVKQKAQELYNEIEKAFNYIQLGDKLSGAPQIGMREASLAKTNLEQSVMWAVKGLTTEFPAIPTSVTPATNENN